MVMFHVLGVTCELLLKVHEYTYSVTQRICIVQTLQGKSPIKSIIRSLEDCFMVF